jgi:hypothetical protein
MPKKIDPKVKARCVRMVLSPAGVPDGDRPLVSWVSRPVKLDAVPALLEAHPPLEALRLSLARVVDYARVKRGVIAAIETSTWQHLHAAEHLRLDRELGALLEQGTRSGDIRAGVDATDVVLLLGALSRVPTPEWDRRAPVVVDVIVNGLSNR